MGEEKSHHWLLLIHQIPPRPNALRVRIWRRLQKVGAVSIKQSVYVLPLSDQAREDMNWILKEITDGGGTGAILEVKFLEGITDEQIVKLFNEARKADYEKLGHEIAALLTTLSTGGDDLKNSSQRWSSRLSRFRRRFDEIVAIDFFQTPQRWKTKMLIDDLADRLLNISHKDSPFETQISDLKGKTWVTRKSVYVDRIACGWLIRRFVDERAPFKFVDADSYSPESDEIRFDMFEAEFSHEGDRCTFEVMIERLKLDEHALVPVAEIVHDLDLKDGKYERAEAVGFRALLTGLLQTVSSDEERMEKGFQLFEILYAYFKE